MKAAATRLSLIVDRIALVTFSIFGPGFARTNSIRLKTRLTAILFAVFLANVKLAIGQEFADHPLLYQRDGLVIMTGVDQPELENWCKNSNEQYLYVFYDAPHTQRPAAISTEIETFARDTIYPRIREICGDAPIKKISFMKYRSGSQKGPPWDMVVLDVLDNGRSLVTSLYYPSDAAKAVLTMEQIAAMMPKEQLGSIDRGKPLYEDGNVKIYPFHKGKDWCTPAQHRQTAQFGPQGASIAIVFSMPYPELRSVLTGNDYFRVGGFSYGVILELLNNHQCLSRVSAFFYEEGNMDYAERVDYGPDNTPYNPKFVELSRSYGRTVESQLNKIEQQQQRLSAWDISCEGPFCDVPGGAYLNAIYRGDASSLKKMDAIAGGAIKVQGTDRVTDLISGAIERAERQGSARDFSLLPIIANRYFFNYQSTFALYCPEGLVGKRVDFTTETYEEYDETGLSAGMGGGETMSAHYVIKPEFAPLCERVCDALGGDSERMLIANTGHEPSKMTLNGLDTMMDRYHCEDTSVRKFERNLVLLTERLLRGWKENPEQPVETSAPEITTPQPETVTAPVTSSNRETHSSATTDSGDNNSIAPTHSRQRDKTGTVEPQQQRLQNQAPREQRSRTATSIEKQQAMMDEIKAVTEEMTKNHQVRLQEFVTRLKNASSMAERTEITQEMKAFQQASAQKIQKAMADIQQRYR